jgi:hypothetical protein
MVGDADGALCCTVCTSSCAINLRSLGLSPPPSQTWFADSKGAGVERPIQRHGLGVPMHTNVAQVGTELRLHIQTERRRQQLAACGSGLDALLQA